MHIYMRHFLHGSKVAISEQEAQYDEKHGWVRYDPEAERVQKTENLVHDSDVVSMNSLGAKRFKRGG